MFCATQWLSTRWTRAAFTSAPPAARFTPPPTLGTPGCPSCRTCPLCSRSKCRPCNSGFGSNSVATEQKEKRKKATRGHKGISAEMTESPNTQSPGAAAVQVTLPYHLRNLARLEGDVRLEVS